MRYTIKDHALQRLRERKIDLEEIEKVLREGQKWFSKVDRRWHACMRGIEVVSEYKENGIEVVTCFFERRD